MTSWLPASSGNPKLKFVLASEYNPLFRTYDKAGRKIIDDSALGTLPVKRLFHCRASLVSPTMRLETCWPPFCFCANDCMAQETHSRNIVADKNTADYMNHVNYENLVHIVFVLEHLIERALSSSKTQSNLTSGCRRSSAMSRCAVLCPLLRLFSVI